MRSGAHQVAGDLAGIAFGLAGWSAHAVTASSAAMGAHAVQASRNTSAAWGARSAVLAETVADLRLQLEDARAEIRALTVERDRAARR